MQSKRSLRSHAKRRLPMQDIVYLRKISPVHAIKHADILAVVECQLDTTQPTVDVVCRKSGSQCNLRLALVVYSTKRYSKC